jgi:hypothetical protein
VLVEDLPCLGELHLLALAGKEHLAQFRFQGFDLQAQGGLGQSQARRRPCDTAVARDSIKAAKLCEFHTHKICSGYLHYKNNKLDLCIIVHYTWLCKRVRYGKSSISRGHRGCSIALTETFALGWHCATLGQSLAPYRSAEAAHVISVAYASALTPRRDRRDIDCAVVWSERQAHPHDPLRKEELC